MAHIFNSGLTLNQRDLSRLIFAAKTRQVNTTLTSRIHISQPNPPMNLGILKTRRSAAGYSLFFFPYHPISVQIITSHVYERFMLNFCLLVRRLVRTIFQI